jgi:hypothetical protein
MNTEDLSDDNSSKLWFWYCSHWSDIFNIKLSKLMDFDIRWTEAFEECFDFFWLKQSHLHPEKCSKSIWIHPKRSLCCYESVTGFTWVPIGKVEIFSWTSRQCTAKPLYIKTYKKRPNTIPVLARAQTNHLISMICVILCANYAQKHMRKHAQIIKHISFFSGRFGKISLDYLP